MRPADPASGATRRWLARLPALAVVTATPALAIDYTPASVGLPSSNAGYDCSPFNPGGWTGIDFADLDGDGDDDLAVVGRLLTGHHVFESDGSGTWAQIGAGFDPDCHGRSDLELADWSGDGKPDLGGVADINGAAVAFRNDSVTFTRAASGLAGGNGEGFTFGDFDGDGALDLATVGHFSGGVRAWFGDRLGNWVEHSSGLPADVGGHRITAGDLDGDKRDEIVSTQFMTSPPATDGVMVWRWDPTASAWNLVASWYFDQPYGVAVGDASNDGWNDILVSTAQDVVGSQGGIHVFVNGGDGTRFTEASTGIPLRTGYQGDMAAGDLDGDGDLDVVVGDWDGVMRFYLNDGSSSWTPAFPTGIPSSFGDKIEGMAVGDLDGDCQLDVGIAAYRAGINVYRRSDSAGCAVLPEAGPACAVCASTPITLDAGASRVCNCSGTIQYRWWDGSTLLQDWSSLATMVVFPTASTTYRVDVACSTDPTCVVSDYTAVRIGGGGPPPALGNVLRMAKSVPRSVLYYWTDLAGTWGDYELVALTAAQGPPTQAAFDGPTAVVLASAPPGRETAAKGDGIIDPPGLVFVRVRATSDCGGAKGPA